MTLSALCSLEVPTQRVHLTLVERNGATSIEFVDDGYTIDDGYTTDDFVDGEGDEGKANEFVNGKLNEGNMKNMKVDNVDANMKVNIVGADSDDYWEYSRCFCGTVKEGNCHNPHCPGQRHPIVWAMGFYCCKVVTANTFWLQGCSEHGIPWAALQ